MTATIRPFPPQKNPKINAKECFTFFKLWTNMVFSNRLCCKITAQFLSKGLKMTTFNEYMAFFDKWLNYQFPRDEDAAQNREILQVVGELVTDADDLQYWANRDNWSMYNYAKELA